MAITNVANFLRSDKNQHDVALGKGMNVFAASDVLSVAFCKAKEEIAMDIATASTPEKADPQDINN